IQELMAHDHRNDILFKNLTRPHKIMSCDELVGEILSDSYERVDGADHVVELHSMDSRERHGQVHPVSHHGFEFERIRESLDVRVIKSRLVDKRPECGILCADNLLRTNAENR